MYVAGGALTTLRTDARSNLWASLHVQIHTSTSHCLFGSWKGTVQCRDSPHSAGTVPLLLFFFFFFLPSLTLNETTVSRFYGKDDQKSVVSLTHCYSTQYSKPAHTEASRGLLYCVVHSHAHMRLPLLHSGAAFIYLFFLTTLQVAECKTASAVGGAKWGQVTFEKWIELSNKEQQRPQNVFCRGSRAISNTVSVGRQRWKEIFESVISFAQFVRTAIDTFFCCVLQLLCATTKYHSSKMNNFFHL